MDKVFFGFWMVLMNYHIIKDNKTLFIVHHLIISLKLEQSPLLAVVLEPQIHLIVLYFPLSTVYHILHDFNAGMRLHTVSFYNDFIS